MSTRTGKRIPSGRRFAKGCEWTRACSRKGAESMRKKPSQAVRGKALSAILVDATISNGKLQIVDVPLYLARIARAAKKWGDGAAIVIRIEPEEEAWRHSDAKHLYGHLYAPVSKRTGETVAEVHLRMKAQFMPDDGRTSITQLNREEIKAFIESVEQDIRETDPESWDDCCDAMELYERRHQYERLRQRRTA